MKKYRASVLMLLLFEGVAVTLWLTKSNLFYLFNFSYIGSCLSVGLALFTAGKRYARQFVQLAVGLYMLVYLGLMSQENMQIEGFWYYLFSGVFEAATIHYAVAKIFGPLLFGRGWCGYACWTAMVLDLLPFKVPQKPRKEKLGTLRYVMFALSFALVSALFLMKFSNLERIMFWLFLIGNILYYAGGIALAFIFKDNRAFCKYLCPITVFLKPMSYSPALAGISRPRRADCGRHPVRLPPVCRSPGTPRRAGCGQFPGFRSAPSPAPSFPARASAPAAPSRSAAKEIT